MSQRTPQKTISMSPEAFDLLAANKPKSLTWERWLVKLAGYSMFRNTERSDRGVTTYTTFQTLARK